MTSGNFDVKDESRSSRLGTDKVDVILEKVVQDRHISSYDIAEELFYGKWYQTYHYSSDNRNLNNCSTLNLITRPDGIYLNQSRVDRGLFHRFSLGKLIIPPAVEDAADLKIKFKFENAPRRLYVWVLSRNEILNDVSKELALRALRQLGVDDAALRKDETACVPKYYEDGVVEPTTFRFPVPI
ncbi:hypothetical protein EVAR_7933_1 [Eumeta japonica]|uniref:Apolipoprotein D n=1 Tax=Eumeta variegata TaxID=151549 RepID=A0A4C1TVB2_EUMVA|nr:hypothetical protein EVAR_7933_1 [Eumeta japonica]